MTFLLRAEVSERDNKRMNGVQRQNGLKRENSCWSATDINVLYHKKADQTKYCTSIT